VAITWIDLLSVLLITVMGMGLWHLCENRVRVTLRGEELEKSDFEEEAQLPRLQRELTQAEDAWKEASKELDAQRLAQIHQAAILAVLAKPTEEYRKALDQSEISSEQIKRLFPYVTTLEIYVGRKEATLSRAKLEAATEQKKFEDEFELHRDRLTLGWAAVLSVALLGVLWAPLSWMAAFQPPGRFHPNRVLAASAILLAVLFGYQVFGAPTLALAIATLLLALLSILLNR
jgi:hypothetical protein